MLKEEYSKRNRLKLFLSYSQYNVKGFSCSLVRRVGKITKSDYLLRHVCLYGTTRLPQGGFSQNLIFEDFSKICQENSSLIKI
jgi:hypothetical protein